ncbi:MAG: hypothetical protein HYV07_26915 [Deltaproteobacteria bacterium]|nr:hypothetical protein [Deltaproteobacteria bacterium]
MIRTALSILLVAGLGCSSIEIIELDLEAEVPEGAHSYLLAYAGLEGGSQLVAGSIDRSDRVFVKVDGLEEEAKAIVLFYDVELSRLGLEAGRVPLLEQGRPLPRPTIAKVAQLLPGAGSRFEAVLEGGDVTDLGEPVASFRIMDFDADVCRHKGGCFTCAGDGCVGFCELPCVLGPVDPPNPPEPPTVASPPDCPAGWTEDDGACNPLEQADQCGPGELRVPGSGGCELAGAACPASGSFAEGPADAVYVDSTAPAGGTGTRASPFSTIASALGAASFGGTIMLASGEHVLGARRLSRPVRLVGACASRTSLRLGSIVSASDLSIENAALDGVSVEVSASLHLAGVVASASIIRSTGTADLLLVRMSGGRMYLASGSVVRSQVVGGTVVSSGTMRLEDLYARDTSTIAISGGNATISRLALRGADARLSVSAARAALGFAYFDGASIVLGSNAELVIEDGRIGPMLHVEGQSAKVSVARAIISHHAPRTIFDLATSDVVLDQAEIRNRAGRVAQLNQGTLRGSDLVIEGEASVPSDHPDGGIETAETKVELERVRITHQPWRGLLLRHGEVTISDVEIDDTRARSSERPAVWIEGSTSYSYNRELFAGVGLYVSQPTALSIARVRISRSTSFGAIIDPCAGCPVGSTRIDDLDVQGVEQLRSLVGDRSVDMLGTGIQVVGGRSISFERVRVEDSGDTAISIYGNGAAAISHAIALRTKSTPAIGGLQYAGGTGLLAGCGQVELSHFRFEDNEYSGITVAVDVQLHGTDGLIKGSPFGVYSNLARPGSAVVLDRVTYVDVEESTLTGASIAGSCR